MSIRDRTIHRFFSLLFVNSNAFLRKVLEGFLGGFSRCLHGLELIAFFILDWLPAKLKHPILPYYLTDSNGEIGEIYLKVKVRDSVGM